MPIPNYQRFMYPLLELAADGEAHSMDEAYEVLAEKFNLTEEDRAELLPSGRQSRYENRVGWARTYLTKAGLLESPGRGQFKITAEGLNVLQLGITELNNQYLMRFPGFVEFKRRDRTTYETSAEEEGGNETTPDEQLEQLHLVLRRQLAQELLARVKQCSPAFFERLVIQLLVAMGYGGSVADAGKAVGRSGDGGIDGIIKRLGLDNIYIQAKRWEKTVSSEVVRTFHGSLALQRASRGVIITTSDFSSSAIETAKSLGNIVLVDGNTLADFMIEYNVGVTVAARYEVKRVDRDFFEEG